MPTRNSNFALVLLCFLVLGLPGCANQPTMDIDPSPSQTLSPSSPTITETSTPLRQIGSPTPIPTLTAFQIELLIQRLQSAYCQLPCYLEITPGETTHADAITIMESMGAYIGPEFYIASFDVFQPTFFILPFYYENVRITNAISLTIDSGDIVQQIRSNVGPNIPEYWSNYSVRGIFEQYGLPDEVVANIAYYDLATGFEFLITYEEIGIVMDVRGSSETRTICIEESYFDELILTLTNTSSSLSLTRGVAPEPTELWYWSPVEEVFGVDEVELYDLVLSQPTVCFDLTTATP